MSTSRISVHSRLAPDGQGILASANGLQWHDLSTRAVTKLKPRESDTGFVSPTISPDGKQIAYWQFREGKPGISEIVVASRTGADARVVCRCEFPGTHRPLNVLAWMPDQRHLVFGDAEGTLWRVPVNGGAREPLGVSVPPRIQGPHVQPDGRGIYFSVLDESAPAELWVLENFLPSREAE